MTEWNPASVKAQLRLTSQRLGQLQEKKDAKAHITRRDIATLLQQGNVALARTKAHNLIQEDARGDLLEVLEMYVGLLLEHFTELEQRSSPSPVVAEAASSVIYAAPHVESKDLSLVKELLVQRLGSDFARSAIANHDNYVPLRVVHALSSPPPSAAHLNDFLITIASTFGVEWKPEPRRQDIVNSLSEILDPDAAPVVDLPRLRQLCTYGLPDEPVWLRPRIWKIFLGILPVLKDSWSKELDKHRESYYDLVRRLLSPFESLAPPTNPPGHLDKCLLDASSQLSRVASGMFDGLSGDPESCDMCPLDSMAPEHLRISCADALTVRLMTLRGRSSETALTPEIRLESDGDDLEKVPSTATNAPRQDHSATETLLAPQAFGEGPTHPKHFSALLRILFLHFSINPGSHSPYIPSLLVPLYVVMCQEIDPKDTPHVEADTFWLFEAMLGEFSELEDEEGGRLWMRRLSEQLSWADGDLHSDLCAKGLDPGLPHYSYRWMAPLLTQTLPLSSVLPVWDSLFACSIRDRGTNPKIEHLLDVCTAMLIRARSAVFRLGKSSRRSPGLWADENQVSRPPSPVRAWELNDAFLEGVSLLQRYPIEAAGGVDRVLQTAVDLSQRRKEASATKTESLSLGARIRVSMWKGFTNRVTLPESPDDSEEEWAESSVDTDSADDGNDTERAPGSTASGLTSRIAANVWKGITNQTAMEVPPSPLSPMPPSSPIMPDSPLHAETIPDHPQNPSLLSPSSIWKYAEKLKDSDTVATLSKVSSNLRAKSLLGSWNSRSTPNTPVLVEKPFAVPGPTSAPVPASSPTLDQRHRRDSVPTMGSVYSPPPRPAFFRPPRDSMLLQPRKGPLMAPQLDDGIVTKVQSLQTSLSALTRNRQSPSPKSGPRPLLLGSSTHITTPRVSRSATNTPDPGRDKSWQHFHRDSQSSASSVSPSDTIGRLSKFDGQPGWESDSFSKVVPLNRKSISPMAKARLASARRQESVSSSAYSSDRGVASPIMSSRSPTARSSGWSQVDSPPTSAALSPGAPIIGLMPQNGSKGIVEQEHMSDSDSGQIPLSPALAQNKPSQDSADYQTDDTSDSLVISALPKSPRMKSKRAPARLGNLRIPEYAGSYSSNLMVGTSSDQELATTPRAMNFDADGQKSSPSSISPRSPRRTRKVSGDTAAESYSRKSPTDGGDVRPPKVPIDLRPKKEHAQVPETRLRKISTDSRPRRPSMEYRERKGRESAAEEGDDEGYDDLLSAYESEGTNPSSH